MGFSFSGRECLADSDVRLHSRPYLRSPQVELFYNSSCSMYCLILEAKHQHHQDHQHLGPGEDTGCGSSHGSSRDMTWGAYTTIMQELYETDIPGFRNFIRMTPDFFEMLKERLAPRLAKQTTNWRRLQDNRGVGHICITQRQLT